MRKISAILAVLGAISLSVLPALADSISTDHSTYTAPAAVNWTCTSSCGFDLFKDGIEQWQGDTVAQTPGDLYATTAGAFTRNNPGSYVLLWPHSNACTVGMSLATCEGRNPGDPTATFTITAPAGPSAGGLVASGTARLFLNSADGTLTDRGTELVVAIAVGIPLAFLILDYILSLIPGTTPTKKQKSGSG